MKKIIDNLKVEKSRSGIRYAKKKQLSTWILFIVPGLLMYSVFLAFPIINSMRLSFYQGVGLKPDTFVGIKNYIELFTNPLWRDRFFNAFTNTCIFFAIHMCVQNTLGLLFANILSTQLKFYNIYRTIIFIPATLAIVVTGFLWKLILNPQWGALNKFLTIIGLKSLAMPWLGDPRTTLAAISLVSSWQWVGLPTMLFLAGLHAIPEDLFEAARIDGASSIQIFWKIKLPLLIPVIGIVSILTFVGNFNAFDVIFAMSNARGEPEYSADLLGTYFYRTAIAGEHPVAMPNMGIGAAVATVTFFILFTGVMIWLILSKQNSPNRK